MVTKNNDVNKCYKIIREKDDGYYYLFHGVEGSRKIKNGLNIADIKTVKDGSRGTEYQSGFHIFLDIGDAFDYLKKFSNPLERDLCIAQCHYVGELRKKEHSRSPVWLADALIFEL